MLNDMSAYERLIERIEDYTSDTLVGSDANITHDEAVRVADALIEWWVDNDLDGAFLEELLDDIRSDKTIL